MIKFLCPNCTQKIGVNDDGARAVISCPRCAQSLVVPATPGGEIGRLPVAKKSARPPVWPRPAAGFNRQALLPYLARLLMNKLVQSLIFQRRHLATTQAIGIEQITALERRLETLQQSYGARLMTYQVRLAGLEQQLARLQERNLCLARENLQLQRQLPAATTDPTDNPTTTRWTRSPGTGDQWHPSPGLCLSNGS